MATENKTVENYSEDYFSHEHDFYKLDEHGNIKYDDKELYISKLILSDARKGLTIGQFIRDNKIHKITGHEYPSEVVFFRQDLETGELTPFSNTLQLTWLQDYIRKTMGILQNSAFVDDDFDPAISWDGLTSDLTVNQLYNTMKNDQDGLGVHIYDSSEPPQSKFVVLTKSRPVNWKIANRTFKFTAGNIFKERKRNTIPEGKNEKKYLNNIDTDKLYVSRNNYLIDILNNEEKKRYLAETFKVEKKFITEILANCINPSNNRIEFKNLAKEYIELRKKLQFSLSYSKFLTSVVQIIISKYIYKYSTKKQGFYLSKTATKKIKSIEIEYNKKLAPLIEKHNNEIKNLKKMDTTEINTIIKTLMIRRPKGEIDIKYALDKLKEKQKKEIKPIKDHYDPLIHSEIGADIFNVLAPLKKELQQFWKEVQYVFQQELVKLSESDKHTIKNRVILERKLTQISQSLQFKTNKLLLSRPFSDLFKSRKNKKKKKKNINTLYFKNLDSAISSTKRTWNLQEMEEKINSIKEIFNNFEENIKTTPIRLRITLNKNPDNISKSIMEAIDSGNARIFRKRFLRNDFSSGSNNDDDDILYSFDNYEIQSSNQQISTFVSGVENETNANLLLIESTIIDPTQIWLTIHKNLTKSLIEISKNYLKRHTTSKSEPEIELELSLSYLRFSKYIDFIKESIFLVESIKNTNGSFIENLDNLKEKISEIQKLSNDENEIFSSSRTPTFSKSYSKKPFFNDRATNSNALSEWFSFHLKNVRTCQNKLVEMKCSDADKEKIKELIIATCDLIPILKEHKRKPYLLFSKGHSLLKNPLFKIDDLSSFYVDLRKKVFPDRSLNAPLDFKKSFSNFEDIFRMVLSKKKREKTWNYKHIKKTFARLTIEPVLEDPSNIERNRLSNLIQSEIKIRKFYYALKNRSVDSFPGIKMESFYRWKDLHFTENRSKTINKNTIAISKVITNKILKKDLNNKIFKNFFPIEIPLNIPVKERTRLQAKSIINKQNTLKNIDFLKLLAGRIVVASDGSFSSKHADIQEKILKWFKISDKEPEPIRKRITKGKERLKIVRGLKSKFGFDFSSSEQISIVEDSLYNIIKNAKDTDYIKEIKSILKKPPNSKKTYFAIFAKKQALKSLLPASREILDYKELILKQSLKKNIDKFYIIQKKEENNVIYYYYVYELRIKEEKNTAVLLSGRMKHNTKFPYHQSLEILFKNLNGGLYTYDNDRWLYPFGYLFEMFNNYFNLNKKYYKSYASPQIKDSPFYTTIKISQYNKESLKTDLDINLITLQNKIKNIDLSEDDIVEIIKVLDAEKELKKSEKSKKETEEKIKKIEKIIKKLKKGKLKEKRKTTLGLLQIDLEKIHKKILKSQKKIDEGPKKISTDKESWLLIENTFVISELIKLLENTKEDLEFTDIDKFAINTGRDEKSLRPDNRVKIFLRKIAVSLKPQILLNKFRLIIKEIMYMESLLESKEKSKIEFSTDNSFEASFNQIQKYFDFKNILEIPLRIKKSNYRMSDKFMGMIKRFKNLCFTGGISSFLFNAPLQSGNFIGFTGLFTFPIIQLEVDGNISILNFWSKMYPKIQKGIPAMNITGVDLGLRTPVSIGDISRLSQNSDFITHYAIEKSELIQEKRDLLISQSNIISKKNIDKAFYLERIAQKKQKKIARLKGKIFLQFLMQKSALNDKQANINKTAAHDLASSMIYYAKTKTSNEKAQFIKTFNSLYENQITSPQNINFYTSFYPNFDNSMLRINTEKLLLSTKSGVPYASQKSQWLYGKIRRYLEESGQIQGIQIFNDTPPSYTSKLSHKTHKEGKKGYLVKILIKNLLPSHKTNKEQRKGYLEKIIIKKSPSVPTNIEKWKKEGDELEDYHFHPLVRNAILRHYRNNPWKKFRFIPLGSGNIFKLDSNKIIDRDSNAAINIASYNPYLYYAYVINLQIDRIIDGESISKSQDKIKNKLISLFLNLYKAFGYHNTRVNFHYPYSYLCLFRVPNSLHKKIATTIYNGLIYHINKPRTDLWKKKVFNEWIEHVENTLLNNSFRQAGTTNKTSEKFIEYISSAFVNPSNIINIKKDITLILRYLKTELDPELNKEDYGTVPIKSLMDLKKLNSLPINFDNPSNDQNFDEEIKEETEEEQDTNLESETVQISSAEADQGKIISSLRETSNNMDKLSENLNNLNLPDPSSGAINFLVDVLDNENAANKLKVFIDTINNNFERKEWEKFKSANKLKFSNDNNKTTFDQIMEKLDLYSSPKFQSNLKNIFK